MGSALSMVTSAGLSEVAMAGRGIIGHSIALGQLSGSQGGLAGHSAGNLPGMGGGPSREQQIRSMRTKPYATPAGSWTSGRVAPQRPGSVAGLAPQRGAAPAPKATPYTETKEYLGGQQRIQGLRGEISKLGAELEAIREKRKALEPTARKMVGRIPLVHTELKGQEKGGGEVKALSKKGRKRLLMSHSVPKGAVRRASA
jgi:hypothetical protein